jgi:hypothetical protein
MLRNCMLSSYMWAVSRCKPAGAKGEKRGAGGTAPYFPDVVELAADLAQQSNADLQDLGDGLIPEKLCAVLKVEK